MILQKEVKFALGLGVIFLLLAAALFVSKEEETVDLNNTSGTGEGTTVADTGEIPEPDNAVIPDPTPVRDPDPEPVEDTTPETYGEDVDDFTEAEEVNITPEDTTAAPDNFVIEEEDTTTENTIGDEDIKEPEVRTPGYTPTETEVVVEGTGYKPDTTPDIEDPEPEKETTPVYTGDGFKYTLQRGDNYSKLAKEFYGKASDWRKIDKANPGYDPHELMPGQEIIIPGPVIKRPGDTGDIAEDVPTPLDGKKYKIKQGETLGSISKKFYGTSTKWKDLKRANKIKDETRIMVGQEIILPGIKDEPKDDEIPNLDIPSPGDSPGGTISKTHIVKQGETLWSIAEMYYDGVGLKYKDIARANPRINKDDLKVGQKLTIPGLRGGSAMGGDYFMYTIQPLDTLSEISSRFLGTATRWREIQVLNTNLNPEKLIVGRKIKIPGKGTSVPVPSPKNSTRSASTVPDVSFGTDSYLGGSSTPRSKTYTVVKGDFLGGISRKLFGSGEYVKQIIAVNPKLRNNPNLLYVGMKLNIPDIPGVNRKAYNPSAYKAPAPSRSTSRAAVSEPPVRRKPSSSRSSGSYLEIEKTRF